MQTTSDSVFALILIGITGMTVLAASVIILQLRGRRKIDEEKKKLAETELIHQSALLRTVVFSQDEERVRIGQDLHDDVGTALSTLRLTIDMFKQNSGMGIDQFSEKCKFIIDRIISDVRNISHNLSPPGITHYGLPGALEELCEMLSQTGIISFHINNHSPYLTDGLDQKDAISLYRIMEELINNTIKHARATEVTISFLENTDMVTVQYADNGIGTDATSGQSRGMGTQNIESRLKVLNATSIPTSQGTEGYSFHFSLQK